MSIRTFPYREFWYLVVSYNEIIIEYVNHKHLNILYVYNKKAEAKEQELLSQLHLFKENIPGIVDLSAGINVTEEVENKHDYTLALRITFENKEALDHYLPHHVHQNL